MRKRRMSWRITRDSGELNPKMEKAITIMGIAAAVIIVLIIVAIVVNLFGGFGSKDKGKKETETQNTQTTQTTETQSAEKIGVPELLGMTYGKRERAWKAWTENRK